MRERILWITRTAVLIALLIVTQAVTAPLGQIVTGSAVNFILIVSVMTFGLPSGLAVAVISPVMAKLSGIGPLWSLIPFIVAGNTVLVLIWHFIAGRSTARKRTAFVLALVCAAAAKFLVLYVGIARVAVPLFLGLPAPQAAVISNMFSIPQLINALIGGALAAALVPRLKKALGE